jgi:hypothetical protein
VALRDWEELIGRIKYAVEQVGSATPLGKYLQEGLDIVTKHVENERFGEGDENCAEIEFILDFIGGEDGQRGDIGSTNGSGSSEGKDV